MGQRGDAPEAYVSHEPAEVADRHGQEPRGGLRVEGPGLDTAQDISTLLFLLGQGNRLPEHGPRVTDSLIC